MKTLLALLGGITFLMTLLFGILVMIVIVTETRFENDGFCFTIPGKPPVRWCTKKSQSLKPPPGGLFL